MNDADPNKSPPPREITNGNLFADAISFSDTEKILFSEDLHEVIDQGRDGLMDGNPADRYTIVKKLNEGGMKAIWEVDDHRTARKVAMALIQSSRIASVKDIDAFLYEARLTANLQHPNIIPIYDIALDENGNPYFTMKALKGKTLGDILKQKRNNEAEPQFTRTRLLSIFLKVCDAMAYAHSKGVLHLDLKPSNIIVGDYGDVHVLDWGLSTLVTHLSHAESQDVHWHSPDDVTLESGQTLTRYLESTASDRKKRNVIGGTPGYMAPEQAKASPADIDFRTDVFMLGAMLYEILTLHHAIEGEDIGETIKKTVRGDIIPPTQHNKKIPPALAAIAMKALAPVKEERYPTVAALIRDIQQYQDGFATEAENPTFVTHLTLLIKRHKKPVSLIALFTLIIIAILANSIRSIKASEREAIAAHTLATQSLEELKEKDRYIRETAQKVAPDYLALFASEENDYQFDAAEKALETGLAFDPGHEPARYSKAVVLICKQRFSEARYYLPPPHPLKQIAKQYNALIPDAQLPIFVQQLQATVPTALPRFFYHLNQQTTFNPQTRFAAIAQTLKQLNPKIEKLNFDAQSSGNGGWKIDISNNPDLENIIPLCGLPITHLNANNTGPLDLKLLTEDRLVKLHLADTPMNHLPVHRPLRNINMLDISGTRIRNITNILNYPELTELNISRIENLTLSEQLIWCRKLTLLSVSRKHQNDPTLQAIARRNVIILYGDQ